ncbi:hypothetical protein [Nocardia rhizosphaerae]|uniref:Uncharacterized protein n=1 Tax=Nocardia rhizosphaerae TaxID=1691571 RepID=A0ABV8L3W1_9NOCA
MSLTDSRPRQICLPTGTSPSGRRAVAWCACGYRTTPRVDRDRALAALLTEHGWTTPVCALCERTHDGPPEVLLRQVEIRDDPDGGQYLVCRGVPRSCLDAGAQLQLRLDRAVSDSWGIEMPRPRLRVIHGGGSDQVLHAHDR